MAKETWRRRAGKRRIVQVAAPSVSLAQPDTATVAHPYILDRLLVCIGGLGIRYWRNEFSHDPDLDDLTSLGYWSKPQHR